MRRITVALVVVLTAVVVLGATSAAEPNAHLNREVSGPFTGTTVFDLSTPRCSFVHQVFDASYNTEVGRVGAFHIDNCVLLPTVDSAFPVAGSFVVTTPNGATLTGTVNGTVLFAVSGAAHLDFTFTMTAGTKQFRQGTGTIGFDATWDGNNPGTIAGTLVGSLQKKA